jgi:hypothetical protein
MGIRMALLMIVETLVGDRRVIGPGAIELQKISGQHKAIR